MAEATGFAPVLDSGTLSELIDSLLPDATQAPDLGYLADFLASFRSFSTPQQVFSMLVSRYKQAVESTDKDVHTAVPMRVLNVMKKWLTTHYYDFEDSELLRELQEFLHSELVGKLHASVRDQLLSILEEKMVSHISQRKGSSSSSLLEKRKMLQETSRRASSSLLPREVARHLTLVEFNYFKNIRPQELRNQAWTKPNADKLAPNIYALTQLINQNSAWVASEIVLQADLEQRRELLKWFLNFAMALKEQRNYNALFAVGMGLNHTGVTRLKKTWKYLPKKLDEFFSELTELISPLSNHKIYREVSAHITPPAVPYLPLFLKDLTFIEDGNPDYLDAEKRIINFAKNRMICAVYRQMQRFQDGSYNFAVNNNLKNYITAGRFCLDQDTIYKKSQEIEPKGSGKGAVIGAPASCSSPAAPSLALNAPLRLETPKEHHSPRSSGSGGSPHSPRSPNSRISFAERRLSDSASRPMSSEKERGRERAASAGGLIPRSNKGRKSPSPSRLSVESTN